MARWWVEEWSFGSDRSRICCQISATEEGFVVDLLHGETCIESFVYPTRLEALEGAHILKVRFKPLVSTNAAVRVKPK